MRFAGVERFSDELLRSRIFRHRLLRAVLRAASKKRMRVVGGAGFAKECDKYPSGRCYGPIPCPGAELRAVLREMVR
jgi:hypothetical protein